MKTVLCIDLQSRLPRLIIILNVLIDPSRTKPLLRCRKFLPRNLATASMIRLNFQVGGLVVVVVGATARQVRQQVEGQDTVVFRVLYFLVLGFGLGGCGVQGLVGEGPRLLAFCDHLSEASVNQSSV